MARCSLLGAHSRRGATLVLEGLGVPACNTSSRPSRKIHRTHPFIFSPLPLYSSFPAVTPPPSAPPRSHQRTHTHTHTHTAEKTTRRSPCHPASRARRRRSRARPASPRTPLRPRPTPWPSRPSSRLSTTTSRRSSAGPPFRSSGGKPEPNAGGKEEMEENKNISRKKKRFQKIGR